MSNISRKPQIVPEHLVYGSLVLWMVKMKDKTILNLNNRKLSADDVSAIGYVLKTNNTLTKLYLSNNNITDVQSIGDALKTNNTLKTLSLQNNNITDVTSIGDALKTNKTLTTLNIWNNNITDVQSIIEALETNNTLKYLYLHNNFLSDNMKSQLKAIQQYKKAGSNGYQQVEGMFIHHYFNKIKLRF